MDGIKRLAQMPLRIVVEATAVKTFVTVGDGPFDDVVKDSIIKIELERYGIIESHIFVADVCVLHHAQPECDDPRVLAPDEKSDLVRHSAPEFAQELLGK